MVTYLITALFTLRILSFAEQEFFNWILFRVLIIDLFILLDSWTLFSSSLQRGVFIVTVYIFFRVFGSYLTWFFFRRYNLYVVGFIFGNIFSGLTVFLLFGRHNLNVAAVLIMIFFFFAFATGLRASLLSLRCCECYFVAFGLYR